MNDNPIIQLLDDFWELHYPNLPRKGNATESKSVSIARAINQVISSSSLYNFLNEKSTPSDASLNRLSYFVLKDWGEAKKEVDLNKKDIPNHFFSHYCKIKRQNQPKTAPIEAQTTPKAKEKPFVEAFELKRKTIYQFIGVATLSCLAVIVFLFSKMSSSTENLPNNQLAFIEDLGNLQIIAVLHVGTLILLLALYFSPFGGMKASLKNETGVVAISLRRFQFGWIIILFSWTALYLWLSIKWGYEKSLLEASANEAFLRFNIWSWALADVISGISSISFFYLFFVMDIPQTGTQNSNRFHRALTLVFGVSLACLLLSIFDRFINLGQWDGIFTLLYSLVTAISMLYFFGRLDSHFFNAKRSLLAPLYLYSVLQVNWSGLNGSQFATQAIFIFFVAFLLKIYLFFIINEWLRSGGFRNYFSVMDGQLGTANPK